MRRILRSRVVLVTVAAGLFLGACGGDDDGDGGDAGVTTSTAAPEDESTTTVDATGEDAVDTDATGSTTTVAEGATTTTAADGSTTTTSLGPPALDTESSVSTVGLDEVTFGMTLEVAQEAAGTAFVPEGPVGRCTVYVPQEAPPGIRFTVVDGTVERVDIEQGPLTTRSGLGVGSTVQQVLDRFGAQAQVSPRPDGSGDDILFVPQDPEDAAFRVVFETDGATVLRYRSGRVPIVLPSAPCAAIQLPEAAPTTSSS